MTKSPKVLYTAKTHTIGGRDNGMAKSSDGELNIKLSPPGSGRSGTNPEQLFAAGWSACLEGTMALIAGQMKITLPVDTAIDAEVDLCFDESAFLQARLTVSLPGLKRDVAQSLLDAAHKNCPYSKAIFGNVKTTVTLA